jgi:predicted amidohydrolase
MQIIAVQPDIAWEDKAANFERIAAQIAGVTVEAGALVVLPEMFATGFSMNVEGIAEPVDGPTHQFLSGIAEKYAVSVIGGVVTRATDGRGLNQAVAFGADGAPLARYSKIYPFSFAGETNHYVGGSEITCFSWQGLQVAPFICYDLRFPEVFRHAVRRGAELLIVIASWPEPRDAHWQALLRARAIENQCFVVGVNRVGSDPNVRYTGHSLILDPRGETLATGGTAPELVEAEIDRAALVEYRQNFPALNDIRGEFLGQ